MRESMVLLGIVQGSKRFGSFLSAGQLRPLWPGNAK
jgi:hypothetical protein